ncbi:MAG: hypothetical protein PHF84_12345 [bacterium]|nr:hypothetical protein [bacterium]
MYKKGIAAVILGQAGSRKERNRIPDSIGPIVQLAGDIEGTDVPVRY